MSCYICNKSISRVKQHLKKQHKCSNTYFEPDTLETYSILLNTLLNTLILNSAREKLTTLLFSTLSITPI